MMIELIIDHIESKPFVNLRITSDKTVLDVLNNFSLFDSLEEYSKFLRSNYIGIECVACV